MENLLIVALFLGAVFYLGNIVLKSFQGKKSCASHCGDCSHSFDIKTTEKGVKVK